MCKYTCLISDPKIIIVVILYVTFYNVIQFLDTSKIVLFM